MLSEKEYAVAKRWVFAGGIVNAVLALPFGLPVIYRIYAAGWIKLGEILGLGGAPWRIPEDAAGIMLMTLASLGLNLVGLTLIYASGNLKERAGIPMLNGIVRILFVLIGTYHLARLNGPRIMYAFVGIDIILGPALVFQSAKIIRQKNT